VAKFTELNKQTLTEDAFLPKLYKIKIEKRHFVEPSYIRFDTKYKARFALRILFDISPYPSRSEWREPQGGPDDGKIWDYKEFVGRISDKLEKEIRAMNDVPSAGMNSCVVW